MIEHGKGSIGVEGLRPARQIVHKCAIDRREVAESSEVYELSNVVETALARALVLAAEAKRWDVVVQIANELRTRSSAPTSQVASPPPKHTSGS